MKKETKLKLVNAFFDFVKHFGTAAILLGGYGFIGWAMFAAKGCMQ